MDRFPIDAFEGTAFPCPREPGEHYSNLVERLTEFTATRRAVMLGMAGASAGLPLIGALVRAASRFEGHASRNAFQITISGICAWQIDARWFDGMPRLEVGHTADALRVRLTRALFPGTDLPADLLLQARRIGSQWVARLAFDAMGFTADFPFHTWLLGHRRAEVGIGIDRLAFRAAPDLRLDGLHGGAAFGPDWLLDLTGLEQARLRIGKQAIPTSGLRLELGLSDVDAEHGVERRMRAWPQFAGDGRIDFAASSPRVSLEAARTRALIETSTGSARLMARQVDQGATLHWDSDGGEAIGLHARHADLALDYAGGRPAFGASSATLARQWHRGLLSAAEFATDDDTGRVLLASNDAPGGVADAATPRAARFVVSVPGCDLAMFTTTRQPGQPAPAPDGYGADAGAFARGAIPLDAYQLNLRRASDAFFMTLRFRHVDLRFAGKHWRLVARPANASAGPEAKALIEYDFGSQHLLEEAIYISDWVSQAVPPSPAPSDVIPVSSELAAYAILLAYADSTQKLWGILKPPLARAVLDANPALRTPTALVAYLVDADTKSLPSDCAASQGGVFDRFKASTGLRDFLGAYGSGEPLLQARRAGATHLLFELAAGEHVELDAAALMSWAAPIAPSPAAASAAARFSPRLPWRAQPAGTLHPDRPEPDPSCPEIRRPRSLAETGGTPDDYCTGIEVPARLVMSPIVGDRARWIQSATQPEQPGRPRPRNELWSVRLENAKVRAVFTPDARPCDPTRNDPAGLHSLPCGPDLDCIQVDIFTPPLPYTPGSGNTDFRAALDARDRHEIVALSALYAYPALCGSPQVLECGSSTTPTGSPALCDPCSGSNPGDLSCRPASDQGRYLPLPIDATLLQLTSLGASFKYDARWDPPASARPGGGALSVERYMHHGQIRRDVMARVEYKYFLFPLGTPLTLVKVTERWIRFHRTASGKLRPLAELVQRFFLSGPAFTRAFPAIGQPDDNRGWAHGAIEVPEPPAHDLADPSQSGFAGLGQSAFSPQLVDGRFVEFTFTDNATHTTYSAPLVCIDNNVAHSDPLLRRVVDCWRNKLQLWLGKSPDLWPDTPTLGFAQVLSGRLPFVAGTSGSNTDLEVDRIMLGVQALHDEGVDDGCVSCLLSMDARMEAQAQPPYYPLRRRSRVTLAQVSALSGAATTQYLMDFDAVYVASGFAADVNPGKIFGRFAGVPPQLDFSGDTSHSGGFASPSHAIVYFSAQRGPVGGNLSDAIPLASPAITCDGATAHTVRIAGAASAAVPSNAHQNNFDPTEFFSAFIGDAKLLGIVRVVDILKIALAASGTKIPTITSESLFDLAEDALRAIEPAVDEGIADAAKLLASSDDVPPVVAARIQPGFDTLQSAWKALSDSLAATSVDQATMLAQLGDFGKAATDLAATAHAIASEPEVLLPADIAGVLGKLRTVFEALPKLDLKALVQAFVLPVARQYAAQAAGAAFDAIVADVAASPELDSLRACLAQLAERAADVSSALAQAQADVVGLLTGVATAIDTYADEIALLLEAGQQAAGAIASTFDAGWSFDDETSGAVAAAVATFGTSVSNEVTLRENELAGLTLPPDKQGACARALAQARQAASTLSDLTLDNAARVDALAPRHDAAPPPKPKQGLGSDIADPAVRQRLGRIDYVAALAAHWLGVVVKVSGVVQGLLDYRAQVASPARADQECLATAQTFAGFVSVLFTALEQPAGNLAGFSLSGLAQHLDTTATTLTPLSPAVPAAFLAQLSASAATLRSINTIVTGTLAAPAACQVAATYGAGISALLQSPGGGVASWTAQVDEVAQTCDRMIQVAAYWAGVAQTLAPTLAGTLSTLRSQLVDGVENKLAQALCDAQQGLLSGQPAQALIRALNDRNMQTVSDYLSVQLKTTLDGLRRLLNPAACDPATANLRAQQQWLASLEQNAATAASLLQHALSVSGIGKLVDVDKIFADIVAALGVPTRLRVSYVWETDIQAYPDGNSAVFEPLDDATLSINAVLEAGLQGGAPSATMNARLAPFKVNLFGKGASNFLSISFKPLTLTLAPGSGLQCHTDVTDVVPGPALGFVQKLQELFGGSSGFFVLPSFRGVTVGYAYSKDMEELGGFLMQNIAFSISVEMPFDNSPVRLTLKLADKALPFLISEGIYGGGGFFAIQTRADTIEILEASFEFGAVTGFTFSVLTGSGRITAGVYIRLGGRSPAIEGFFCATGEVSLAGLITMGATLRVSLAYELNSNAMLGTAQFEFDFSIGFLKYAYAIAVQYARQGDGGGSSDSNDQDASNAPLRDTARLALSDAAPAHPYTAKAWQLHRDSIEADLLETALV